MTGNLLVKQYKRQLYSSLNCCSMQLYERRRSRPDSCGLKTSSRKVGRKASILSHVSRHNCVSSLSRWSMPAVCITSNMFFSDSGIASDYNPVTSRIESFHFNSGRTSTHLWHLSQYVKHN